MRLIIATTMILAMLASDALPTAKDTRRRRAKTTTMSADHVIKDLTVPWPFRKHWIGYDFAGITAPDSDGDGVADGVDRCPGTASGVVVDRHGCPVEKSETETQFLDTGVIRASNIYFESAKADIKPESHGRLDEIGGVLAQWPDLKVEVGGHTDAEGTDEFNETLSADRAKAVRDYLVGKFPQINPRNLSVKGYGKSAPVASNETEAGRAQNRRVEFTVKNKRALKRIVDRKSTRHRRR
jgi:outer membrane protein OmpA-like peptidoglycan-associated protein